MPKEVMVLNPLFQHVWRRARGPVGDEDMIPLTLHDVPTSLCPYKIDWGRGWVSFLLEFARSIYRSMKAMNNHR